MPAAVPAGGTMVTDVAVPKATTVGVLLRGQAEGESGSAVNHAASGGDCRLLNVAWCGPGVPHCMLVPW
jgi:hypothetical protein